jgi:EAL domain-containing protein (putative c-di-GMP-specific phosphodiesterase class I)
MAYGRLIPVIDGQESLNRSPRIVPRGALVEDDVSVRRLLDRDAIVTYFQPILSARQRSTLGVEALARAPLASGYVMGAPELFARAADEGLVAELERRCCEKAIARFARLPHRRDEQVLFVNLGAWVVANQLSVVDDLTRHVRRVGLSPRQVAIEILEDKAEDVNHLGRLVQRFREEGFLVVLDDVGAGHSNLDRVPLLKPDILKVDRSLVANIDADFHKQETIKSLVGLSRRIGALVIAEGMETEREAIVALELGADLLQGYLLGEPVADPSVLLDGSGSARAGIHDLAAAFKAHMVLKINQRKLQHRRYNILLNEILCHLANGEVEHFDGLLRATVGAYPTVECVYVLDGAGIQLTETIWNPSVKRREDGAIFKPAPKGTDHSLKEYYYILLDVELQKYTTEPYVSFASGNISRTISTYFRDAANNTLYVLCIDVLAQD